MFFEKLVKISVKVRQKLICTKYSRWSHVTRYLTAIGENSCHVTIISQKILLKMNKYYIQIRRIPKILRRFWVILIFRFIPYLLNMICLKLWFIYYITYVYLVFLTQFYRFLETWTSDRTNIGSDQLLKLLASVFTPFHFT